MSNEEFIDKSPVKKRTDSNDSSSLLACKKCGTMINEGHAYELGDDRWHIHCFKCSKCSSSLGCNSNFLVLGNGSLICSNCSYSCHQCGKKIDDLAILTGDQAYCSSCFKCRSCKQKIEDLRYARTSRGLFCMSCHDKLIAKKKKYDMKKKHALLQHAADNDLSSKSPENVLQPKNSNGFHDSLTSIPLVSSYQLSQRDTFEDKNSRVENRSSTSLQTQDKELPGPPITDKNSVLNSYLNMSKDSKISINSEEGKNEVEAYVSPQVTNVDTEFSIEEVNDSDDELNKIRALKKKKEVQEKEQPTQFSTPPLTSSSENNATVIVATTEDSQQPTTPKASDHLQASAVINSNPNERKEGQYESPSPVNRLQAQQREKNFFLLSPNQFHDKEFHRTTSSGLGSPDMNWGDRGTTNNLSVEEGAKSRSSCSSPFAKANREARVVESYDYVSNANHREEDLKPSSVDISTPKKAASSGAPLNESSPPPKVPVPEIPSTPNKHSKDLDNIREGSKPSHTNDNVDNKPKGLGLEGIDYEKKADSRPLKSQRSPAQNGFTSPSQKLKYIAPFHPAVTNLEEENKTKPEVKETKTDVSRKQSILRTPKLSIKHKRSISGGNGSLTGKLNLFKSNNKESPVISGHIRNASEGSVVNDGAAFQTPPLPLSSPIKHTEKFSKSPFTGKEHVRSSSDNPFLKGETPLELLKHELELRTIRMEIYQFESQRSFLIQENKKLGLEFLKLSDQLSNLQSKYGVESLKYENLLKEILSLEKRKQELVSENKALKDDNKKLEASNASLLAHHKAILTNNSQSFDQPSTNLHNSNNKVNVVSMSESGQDDTVETLMATKLRFWRRPKASPNLVNQIASPNISQNTQTQVNSGSYRSGQAYPSMAIRPPNFKNSVAQNNSSSSNHYSQGGDTSTESSKKGLGSFMLKSKSTNILDSFLNGSGSSSASGEEITTNDENENDAPLFTSSIQKRADYENEEIPLIITKCIQEVEKRGLDMEGIYRISGGNSAIVAIEEAFANLPANPSSDESQMRKLEECISGDINAVTSALKRYLRKLPDPIITYNTYNEFIKVCLENSDSSEDYKLNKLKENVIKKLPSANKRALYALCKHLSLVNSYSSVNRMSYKNLSVVFAPTLARDFTGEREITDMKYRNEVTELILSNFEKLFTDLVI